MNNAGNKIALFDFDGTLVSGHLWLGLMKHHLEAKENLWFAFRFLISHLALAPFWKMKLISTEKYYQSWGKDVAQLIKGIRVERAKEIFNWIADEYLLPTLKNNVFEKLKEHQEDGFLTILTSGSFQNLVDTIANRLKIDFAIGTELEVNSGQFSGRIIPPLCFGREKAEKVKKFLSGNNLKINPHTKNLGAGVNFKESFAYSDSIFDLPMLELVGNPVAVEPDKKLLEIAKSKGWQII